MRADTPKSLSTIVFGLVICAALGLAGAVQAQARTVEPVYHEAKQWIVACDNTRRCEARFVLSEFAPPPVLKGRETGLMSVVREGGAAGQVTVTLAIPGRYDEAARQKTL